MRDTLPPVEEYRNVVCTHCGATNVDALIDIDRGRTEALVECDVCDRVFSLDRYDLWPL